jgi:hypothetical protein
MKQQDKAIPTLIGGIALGAALVATGFYVAAAVVTVVAFGLSNSYWSVVREGEAEAQTTLWIYKEIKSYGTPSPDRDKWVLSLSYQDIRDIQDLCRFNGQSHIARWLTFEWMDVKEYKTMENVPDRDSVMSDISYDVEFYKTHEQRMKEEKAKSKFEKAKERVKFED